MLFLPAEAKGNNYKFERLFTRHSISKTFDNLRVPTTKFNLVTRESKLEVEPTYQPIMDLHTCRILSEEILGPTEYCRSSKGGHYGGHYGGHLGGPLGGHYGGHKGGPFGGARLCLHPTRCTACVAYGARKAPSLDKVTFSYDIST